MARPARDSVETEEPIADRMFAQVIYTLSLDERVAALLHASALAGAKPLRVRRMRLCPSDASEFLLKLVPAHCGGQYCSSDLAISGFLSATLDSE